MLVNRSFSLSNQTITNYECKDSKFSLMFSNLFMLSFEMDQDHLTSIVSPHRFLRMPICNVQKRIIYNWFMKLLWFALFVVWLKNKVNCMLLSKQLEIQTRFLYFQYIWQMHQQITFYNSLTRMNWSPTLFLYFDCFNILLHCKTEWSSTNSNLRLGS